MDQYANNSGGGFQSSPGQGDGFGASQGSAQGTGSGKKRPSRDKQTLTPVTLKQLAGATQEDDAFMLDNKELTQVSVVGCITEAKKASTNITLQIEDGTESMEIKQWIDEDDTEATAQQREAFTEGAFVKVVGQVRSFGGKSTITAYNVKAVTDHNEITTHFLDAVYVHLFNTRGPIKGSKIDATNSDTGAVGGGTFDNSGAAATFSGGAGGYGDTGAGAGGGSDFTSVQDKVLAEFSKSADESGMDIKDVIKAMEGQGVNGSQVREAVEYLAGEGHLYSTIDEEHFKSTAC